MAENTEIATETTAVEAPKTLLEQFNEILNSSAPDWDKLIDLLKDNPDFAISEELRNQLFPSANDTSGIGINTPPLEIMEKNTELLQKYYEADPVGFDKFIKEPFADNSNIVTRLESYINITEKKLSKIDAAQHPELTASLSAMLSAYNSAAQIANSALPPLNVNGMDNVLRISEQQNTPALRPQEKQNPQAPKQELPTQTAVAGEIPDKKQDNKAKKKDNKFDGIKNKDIIDYLYEDVILKGLSALIKGAWNFIDRFIDTCEISANRGSKKINEKAASVTNNKLKQAMQCCSAVMGNATHTNSFLNTRNDRKGYIQAITQDIQNHVGQPANEWEFITNPKMIDQLNQAYATSPEIFNQHVQLLQENKTQDELLDMQDRLYRVASLQARCQQVDKYLNAPSYEKVINDTPDLAKATDKNYHDLYTCMQLAGAVATDDCAREGITDPKDIAERRVQYMQNFLAHVTETTNKWQTSLTNDVTSGLFKANDDMKKIKRQESAKYATDSQDLLSDMLDETKEYKHTNENGKTMTLKDLVQQEAVAANHEHASDANMAAEALNLQNLISNNIARRQGFFKKYKQNPSWQAILHQNQGR